MKFYVHVEQFWTYEIDADSPEDAAEMFDYEHGGGFSGDCTGYGIAAVTSVNEPTADDERAPVPCRAGCGKTLDPSMNDICIDCLIAQINARSAVSS